MKERGVQWIWEGAYPEPYHFNSREAFLNLGEVTFQKPFVLALQNGHVVGKRGDVLTEGGTVLTDVSPEIPRREHHHFLLDRGRLRKPDVIEGTVLLLNCGPHTNYFHFLFDAIARLMFLKKASLEVDYYCTAYHTRFQRELCTLFGIDRHKVIPLERKTHLQVKTLLVTSLPGYNQTRDLVHIKNKSVYTFVRQHMLTKVKKWEKKYAPNIYIQRSGRRSLMNEEALLNKLKEVGSWDIVRLEEYPVLEQAAIFKQAKLIVGVHGAGLANIIYCSPGTMLIEIFHPNLLEPVYHQIASLFHIHYVPLIGEAVTNEKAGNGKLVWVNPQAVAAGCLAVREKDKVA